MIAKYFATSLAIEKVVSAPRVISNCLPIATTSMSLVGLLIQIHHIAGLFGSHRPGVHGQTHIGLRQRRASLVPSPVIATRRPSACSFLI